MEAYIYGLEENNKGNKIDKYGEIWFSLKEFIESKSSYTKEELLVKMTDLEIELHKK